MKSSILLAVLLGSLVLLGCLGGQATPTPTPTATPTIEPTATPTIEPTATPTVTATATPTPEANEVRISGYKFVPDRITVKKGSVVTWVNEDQAAHTVTSDTGTELDSALLQKGQSYTHTFETIGLYTYHCSPHPYMKASVEVVE